MPLMKAAKKMIGLLGRIRGTVERYLHQTHITCDYDTRFRDDSEVQGKYCHPYRSSYTILSIFWRWDHIDGRLSYIGNRLFLRRHRFDLILDLRKKIGRSYFTLEGVKSRLDMAFTDCESLPILLQRHLRCRHIDVHVRPFTSFEIARVNLIG